MRQKLVIAGILIHEPQVIFLDEPVFGLDPKMARLVKDILVELSRRGTTVFMSTHILELAEKIATVIAIIDKGELIVSGDPDSLREKTKGTSLENIYLQLTGNTEYAGMLKYL
jgi:ABC-2 type transport system ATP-binding protein